MGAPPKDRVGPWVGAGVFLVTAGVSVALAAPGGHWLDSAEFAAASFELGNAHPPGHPLAIALGKAATLVPLGGIAFRVNCLSGLALGLAAVWLLFLIRRLARAVWRWSGQSKPPADAVLWPAAAAGALAFSLGYAALYQGVRAEVYALNLALNLGAVHLLLRYVRRPRLRDLLAAGLLFGLGLCNHHLLTLAVLPAGLGALAVLRTVAWRRRLAHLGLAAAAAGLGLVVYAQLPVRSLRAPEINWGAPHTAERFVWTVSAKLFSRTAERSLKRRPASRVTALAAATSDQLSPGVLLAGLLALAALIAWGVRRRELAPAALLGLAALGNGGAAVLAGFEPDNPDSLGYVLLLFALLTAGAAVVLSFLLSVLRQRPPWRRITGVLAATLVLWPALSLASGLRRVDLRGAHGAEVTARFLLDSVPPGALLLTSYYQTGFGVWAVRILEGARPDVDHVHRSYLSQPGYPENVVRRHPRLSRVVAGLNAPRQLGLARMHEELKWRPVLFEFDDDTYQPTTLRYSTPLGPLTRLLPIGPVSGGEILRRLKRSAAVWSDLERRLAQTAPDPLTRMYLLWARYLRARYHLVHRHCTAARPHWQRARQLGNPKDPALEAIRRQCKF